MEQDKTSSSSIPHYRVPNFSSILPEYTNNDSQQIYNAFNVGNFHSITKIPNKIAPDELSKSRHKIIDANRHQIPKTSSSVTTACGTFSQFEYISSRYDLPQELAKTEKLLNEAKAIGRKTFICSGKPKVLKHEDAYEKVGERFPYMGGTYEHAHDAAKRGAWIASQKILHGAFNSTGNRKSLENTPTKSMCSKILADIQDIVQLDWQDCRASVSMNADEELIVVSFDVLSLDSELGAEAYMNVFARGHELMTKYQLQKCTGEWAKRPGDGRLYFSFRPPWIRNRPQLRL